VASVLLILAASGTGWDLLFCGSGAVLLLFHGARLL